VQERKVFHGHLSFRGDRENFTLKSRINNAILKKLLRRKRSAVRFCDFPRRPGFSAHGAFPCLFFIFLEAL
jgi:hypothetical protein